MSSDRDERFDQYLTLGALIHGGVVRPTWLQDGDSFWYMEGDPDERVAYRVLPAERRIEPFFDAEALRQVLVTHLGHAPPYAGLPFDTFAVVDNGRCVSFEIEGRSLTLDLSSYTISERASDQVQRERARTEVRLVRRPLQTGEADVYESKSPDDRWIIGESNWNLTIRATIDGRTSMLTEVGTEQCPFDLGSVLWSPDSTRILAARVDYTGVDRLPIVHWLQQRESIDWMWYPRTGGAMPQIELAIFDVRSRRSTLINTGPEVDQMLFPHSWTPDGTGLYILKLGRTMKPAWLLRADAATGATILLHHEPVDAYLPHSNLDEPQEGLFTPLRDGRFIWLSERTGWSHLYLHAADGNLVRPLTSGAFPVLRVVAIDEEDGWVYFLANGEERLYDTNLYRVSLEGSNAQRLTEGDGVHDVVLSPSRRYFIDTFSSPTSPPVVELRSGAGLLVMTLSRADVSELQDLRVRPPEEFVVPAADGETPLYGLIYLPSDFDPQQQYPVIEYIYGGPQVIATPHTFDRRIGFRALPRALSELGCVVVIVDGRGTRGRSKAFHGYSYGAFGQTVIPDHVASLQALARERPYLDLSRVGIYGHSWGGYNVLRAMLLASDLYKVGVAGAPVADLEDHYGEWAEGVMGLLRENPDGYAAASNLPVAGNLRGKLLLIHGTSDANATLSATMKMADALAGAGKPFDLLLIPGEDHHPHGTRERYWIDAVKRYFTEHLLA